MTQTMTYCYERCRRVCVTELYSNQRMGEPRRPNYKPLGRGRIWKNLTAANSGAEPLGVC